MPLSGKYQVYLGIAGYNDHIMAHVEQALRTSTAIGFEATRRVTTPVVKGIAPILRVYAARFIREYAERGRSATDKVIYSAKREPVTIVNSQEYTA